MTIKELREKRNKLLVDAQAIMSGANVTAEHRTQVDAMLAESNTIKADIERLESIEAETRTSSNRIVPRDNPGNDNPTYMDHRSWEERRVATNRALRTWFSSDPEVSRTFERRDLTVGSNGSVMIPVGTSDPRIAQQSYGSVYDLVNKMRTTTGEGIKIPYLNDTANLFVLNSASVTVTDPATGGVTSQVDDIRMNPILIENSLIQDVGFDLVGYITTACQTRYLRTMSKWITVGNTSNVAGYAVTGGYVTGLTGATTLVTKYADIVGAIAALDPAYAIGAAFVMNNATLTNQIMNITDTNGRPIFLPFNDGAVSGFTGTLLGFPVKLNQYSPNNGVGNFYLHFGNFEAGYTLREVQASPDVPSKVPGLGTIMLRRLDERYAELNKTGFVAFARVGGSITNPGSVNGSPAPIVCVIGR